MWEEISLVILIKNSGLLNYKKDVKGCGDNGKSRNIEYS